MPIKRILGRSHSYLRGGAALGAILISGLILRGGVNREAKPAETSSAISAKTASKKEPVQAISAHAPAKVDFERDLTPILKEACGGCHSAKDPGGKFVVETLAGVLRGGGTGKSVIPGNANGSVLYRRISGDDKPQMPLGEPPLSADKIAQFKAWIDQITPDEVASALAASDLPAQAASAHSAAKLDFDRDVLPIFKESCTGCHSGNKPAGQLGLETLVGALHGGIAGKAVIAGNAGGSILYRRLTGEVKPQMPFGKDPLAAEKIAKVKTWIDQLTPAEVAAALAASGGRKQHWAYVKPVRPEPPAVKNPGWLRNPIDNFVLARLEKEGLAPSPEASRETLIRRVTLDLIGLPPTPAEIDAFVADKSPDAYEKVVDRLLASPHYGERWARPWLDLARYADSNGYEKDKLRVAWKFRDWVIKALNDDMSFRQFTIEQIAGDMLVNPTTDQLIASGFQRNSMLNTEGGVDHEEYRFYTLVDRVNTLSAVWLGSTLACAQCHNHKYDPFTQKDFYNLVAFYDNQVYREVTLGQGDGYIEEPDIEVPTPEQDVKGKALRAEMANLKSILETSTPDLERAQEAWEKRTLDSEKDWAVLRPRHLKSQGGATLTLQTDGSVLSSGANPEADTYSFEVSTEAGKGNFTALRVEVLRDPSLPHNGPGRDDEGNFFLSNVVVQISPSDQPGKSEEIKWKEAFADEEQAGYAAKNVVVKQENYVDGWAIEPTTSPAPPRRQLVVIPEKPFGFESGTRFSIRLLNELQHASRNLGRFRLSVTTTERPQSIVDLPAKLAPLLGRAPSQRSEEETKALAAAYRKIAPLLQPTRDLLAEKEKALKDLNIPTAMILRERPNHERPSTLFRIRGGYLSPGERVYANVPAVLPPLPESQMPNRLGLASWLVSDENPLTARIVVNRFWEQIYGRGIVNTSEDFGTQGEPPSHPELLDWLATEFMQQGWSMKKILRTIVTSAAYRQTSDVSPQRIEQDPYNTLLARGPRVRVEAEMIRDVTLAASGLLSPKIGGPSVMPPQPDGVWDIPYSTDKWVTSEGEDAHRRGLYTFYRRSAPYPTMLTFDAPSREVCTVRRVRTNTPLQALDLLNNPTSFEAARALAKRLVNEGGADPASRATLGFRLCTSRRPVKKELATTLGYYQAQLEKFQRDMKAAKDLIQDDKVPEPVAPTLAAWTMVSNVLLSLDETVTKE